MLSVVEVLSASPLRDCLSVDDYGKALRLTLDLLNLVKECLARESVNDPIYVMFSGGRDSLVVLHLALQVFDDVRALYVEVNGNTHEENVSYVYKICNRLGVKLVHLKREDMEFYERVSKWGWPGPRRKWCMTEFKRRPIEFFFREKNVNVVLVGVKASDSARRRTYFLRDGYAYRSSWRTTVVRPIVHWSDEFVARYIEENELEINPLYEKLGESGNCVYCPFIVSREYYRRLAKYYPHWFRKIVETEKKVVKGKPFLLGKRKVGICELIGLSEERIYQSTLLAADSIVSTSSTTGLGATV